MASFILQIIQALLWLLTLAIVINAVLSWLIAFDVISLRNPTAAAIVNFLDAVTRPVLAPFRKVIPTLGGVDISPLIALIVLGAVQQRLLPWLFGFFTPILG